MNTWRILKSTAFFALLIISGVTGASAQEGHPQSAVSDPEDGRNAEVFFVPIRFPDATVIQAEVARTPQIRTRGLMKRHHLPQDQGMLFVFEESGDHGVWMKNTWIDLDIIYLDDAGRVVVLFESVPRTVPETPEDRITEARAVCRYILEVPAGTVRRRGLKIGDTLAFENSLSF